MTDQEQYDLIYNSEFSDKDNSPEHLAKIREESKEWRYPKLDWPPTEVIQRWGVYDNYNGLRCVTIYAKDEIDAEHQYVLLFGKNPGYGFIIAPETTHLVHDRNYYPPGQEPITPEPKKVEYDTWYQPYEVKD